MTKNTLTERVIQKLRQSEEAYSEAAEREGKIWGATFSSPDQIKAREADQRAARELGLAQQRMSFARLAREAGWHFTRGLSLACGSGRAERELIRLGVCKSFLGIDLSEAALDEARRESARLGLDIQYGTGDLNRLELPKSEFDLVVTQNCLHHVLELEYLASQIWNALKPGGRVWIDDFVGETQFQWLDERLALVNAILTALPDSYRVSSLT
jgi:SAM-dependent methyltransferase